MALDIVEFERKEEERVSWKSGDIQVSIISQ